VEVTGTSIQRPLNFQSSSRVKNSDRSTDVIRPVGPSNPSGSGSERPQFSNQSADNQSGDGSPSGVDRQDNLGQNDPNQLPFTNRPVELSENSSSQSRDSPASRTRTTGQGTENISGTTLPNIPQGSRESGGSSSRSTGATTAPGSTDEGRGPNNLTPQERQLVQKLRRIDRKVRAHERAHLAAAGPFAQGGPSFEFIDGPVSRQYAVGGSVSLDTSKADTPEETIDKMSTVRQAALAPANPSPQDMQVANEASQKLQEARQKKRRQERRKRQGESNQVTAGSDETGSSSATNQAGESGESGENRFIEGSNRDQPSEPTDESEGIGESTPSENGDQSPTDEPEFFEEFGATEFATQQPRSNNQPQRSDDSQNDSEERFVNENSTQDNGNEFRVESESTDEANVRSSSFTENEDDQDAPVPSFITGDRVERDRRNSPGQLFDLVI